MDHGRFRVFFSFSEIIMRKKLVSKNCEDSNTILVYRVLYLLKVSHDIRVSSVGNVYTGPPISIFYVDISSLFLQSINHVIVAIPCRPTEKGDLKMLHVSRCISSSQISQGNEHKLRA